MGTKFDRGAFYFVYLLVVCPCLGVGAGGTWDLKKVGEQQKRADMDKLLQGITHHVPNASTTDSALLDLKGYGETLEHKVCGRHGCNIEDVLSEYTAFHNKQLDFSNGIPHSQRRFLVTTGMASDLISTFLVDCVLQVHGIGNRMAVYCSFLLVAILSKQTNLIEQHTVLT